MNRSSENTPYYCQYDIGIGAPGSETVHETAAMATNELMRDATSATGATAAATAAARLRKHALDVDAGHLIAPPNCGTELYDVIDLTDAVLGLSAVKRRVRGIRWTYAPLRGLYDHRLELMPL